MVQPPSRLSSQKSEKFKEATFVAERVIGNGSFGVVFQATEQSSNETVAIKKVYQDPRYRSRELQIMKELCHPNVVSLKDAFFTKGDNNNDEYLNLVMEYMPETVNRVSRHYVKHKKTMPIILVKLYAYQTFRALAYIHALGYCHRDIKPHNLLVNTSNHSLKLCDFGSAKKLIKDQPNVSYICSRYYRAPELLFGAKDYTKSIDIWSVGCIIAELLLG